MRQRMSSLLIFRAMNDMTCCDRTRSASYRQSPSSIRNNFVLFREPFLNPFEIKFPKRSLAVLRGRRAQQARPSWRA